MKKKVNWDDDPKFQTFLQNMKDLVHTIQKTYPKVTFAINISKIKVR
jgi:hypothetical protein